MRVAFAPRALQDIDEILTYIYARSLVGARNVSLAIEHTIALCGLNPFAGLRTDRSNVFRAPLSRYHYAIFYPVDEARDRVEIVRVVHGARLKQLGKSP